MVFVYQSDECRASAASARMQDYIDELKDRVEADEGSLMLFEPFGPFLVRKSSDMRIIAKLDSLNGDRILYLLHAARKPDKTYDQFRRDSRTVGNQMLQHISIDAVRRWVTARKEQGKIPEARPKLPREYEGWLEPTMWHAHNREDDVWVYESRFWIERFRGDYLNAYCESFYNLALQVVDQPGMGECLDEEIGLRILSGGTCGIVFRHYDVEQPFQRSILFLAAPFLKDQRDAILSDADYTTLVKDLRENRKPVSSLARRAYPMWIVGDYKHWRVLQGGDQEGIAGTAGWPNTDTGTTRTWYARFYLWRISTISFR